LEVWIVIKLNVQVVANGVFDLSGLGLRPVSTFDFLLKILVKNGDGLNFYFDATRL
jgi:hypothetical protein